MLIPNEIIEEYSDIIFDCLYEYDVDRNMVINTYFKTITDFELYLIEQRIKKTKERLKHE